MVIIQFRSVAVRQQFLDDNAFRDYVDSLKLRLAKSNNIVMNRIMHHHLPTNTRGRQTKHYHFTYDYIRIHTTTCIRIHNEYITNTYQIHNEYISNTY